MDYATHIRTGKRCYIIIHQGVRCFCNFFNDINQFTWVSTNELRFDEGAH